MVAMFCFCLMSDTKHSWGRQHQNQNLSSNVTKDMCYQFQLVGSDKCFAQVQLVTENKEFKLCCSVF